MHLEADSTHSSCPDYQVFCWNISCH